MKSDLKIAIGMHGRAEPAFIELYNATVQYTIIPIAAFYTLMLTMTLLDVSVPLTTCCWKIKFISVNSD